MSGAPNAPKAKPDKNLELVRGMGADWYDPIPPDQHGCFLDPEFTLTPRGHRLLACLRSHTIRAKKGGRTPYAQEGRRTLYLKDLAAELDWDMAATLKVWAELEDHGLARRDDKQRLWLCGKVNPKRRKNGEIVEGVLDEEQEWQKFCTDNFPTYLAKQFQQLSKTDRASAHTDVEAWEGYEKRAAAEAMAAAREQVQKLRDQHFAERYQIKMRRFERKMSPDAPPRPEPIVELSLLRTPKLSVQDFSANSVQDENGTLYNVQNDGVQTTPNKEVRSFKQSDIYSSSSSSSEMREALSEYGTVDDDVPDQLLTACRRKAPDCTGSEVIHFIHEKGKLITDRVGNPIGFLLVAVPKCFEPEPLRQYREKGAMQMPEHLLPSGVRRLRRQVQEAEAICRESPDDEELRGELVQVRNLLRLEEEACGIAAG